MALRTGAGHEALADALAVFERLHGHERQRRYETEGLLEAVRILMGAQSCTAAFRELVAVLARLIPFEDAFLLQGVLAERTLRETGAIKAGTRISAVH